jgi:hypothetical protein
MLKNTKEKSFAPTGVIRAERRSTSGRIKHRSVVELGDEIAGLYHRDGVRHFEFCGSNPIPSDERKALLWIGGLKRILKSLDVDLISFGMTTPSFEFRPRVREALTDIGFDRTPLPRMADASSEVPLGIRVALAAS